MSQTSSPPHRKDKSGEVIRMLADIGKSVALNGEGIFGTRPWRVNGEGPSTEKQEKGRFGGLKDVPAQPFNAADFRFTTTPDGKTLYAFCLAMTCYGHGQS